MKGILSMKNVFKDAFECMKGLQISKHYDSETKILCGKCEGAPLTLHMKGDFTVNAIQILAFCAVASAMCISCAVAKKLKK